MLKICQCNETFFVKITNKQNTRKFNKYMFVVEYVQLLIVFDIYIVYGWSVCYFLLESISWFEVLTECPPWCKQQKPQDPKNSPRQRATRQHDSQNWTQAPRNLNCAHLYFVREQWLPRERNNSGIIRVIKIVKKLKTHPQEAAWCSSWTEAKPLSR